ncbi:hypothetical protein KUCAC02_013340 [Chaenocephalus aceratus]|nr:hypothetical protein KUCAC02_013340 [Chaenocephalus aceratus]
MDTTALPYDAPEFENMPKNDCMTCGKSVPLQLLPLHIGTCQCDDIMVLNNIIWPGEGDNEDDDEFVETVTEDMRKQLVKFGVGWELPMPDMQMEVIQGDHPTSSTCFHILRLPCHYSSYEQLHDNLESCIATAEYGFGLI